MSDRPLPPALLREIDNLTPEQLTWLSGYAWARAGGKNVPAQTAVAVKPPVTVLSASQTGNARAVAEQLAKNLAANKINNTLIAAGDYKSKTIAEEDIVLLVCSTQGEGDPPEEAIPLFKFLTGKKAPDLQRLNYAVLALGDSTYPDFCGAGKLFDRTFTDLGATALLPRLDCDVDYREAANQWITAVTARLATMVAVNITAPAANQSIIPEKINLYNKDNPYNAVLSVRQKITARAADKDIEHVEITIGDHLTYLPGDALGVWPHNDPALVSEILAACNFTGAELITLENGEEVTIRRALEEYDEITQNYPKFIKGLAAFSLDEQLLHIANNPAEIQELIANTSILTLLQKYPAEFFPKNLHDFLRPLTPRFYSIASSVRETPDEVHLTVAVVNYPERDKTFTGAASGFLGGRLAAGDTLKVFIEPNTRFRLPDNQDTAVIMIAAGTGIAPFRAFMQERENTGAGGKNWLLFGNQRFTDDFLYQLEWQQWHKQGLLTHISLAWSRDDPKHKVYVQHKILAEAALMWQWLQAGAHIYVCGNANAMAKDVEKALITAIAREGKLSRDDAEDYLNNLREDNRYQRDVY